jgi:deazaflavin-dependent oxidoreductase (nitroreductase family)
MTDYEDWNAKIIKEFRENEGRVGGQFEGAPMVLVHHKGRKSGKDYVTPLMFLPADGDADVLYIFASKAGAPEHPEWYHNLLAQQTTNAEVGAETYPVSVIELAGADRDVAWDEQVRRYPGFGEYAEKTKGIRTIPVLALRRS